MAMASVNKTYNSSSNPTNHSNTSCRYLPGSPSPVKEPDISSTFRVVFMALIISFAFFGNVLVCRGAIARRNRPFVYYMVINLSLAEIVISLMQPFNVVYERSPFSWVFGEVLCNIVNPLQYCATLVVTFTLATIAVYRAIIISQPYTHRHTKRAAFVIIASSWIWGTALVIPDAMATKLFVYTGCENTIKVCKPAIDMTVYEIVYYVAFLVLPYTLMLASYGLVICKIKKHMRITRDEENEMSSVHTKGSTAMVTDIKIGQQSPPTPQPSLKEELPEEKQLSRQRTSLASGRITRSKITKLEIDVLNMIYIQILIFIVCYLPGNIMFILVDVAKAIDWDYRQIFLWYMNILHALPSALHPICFGTMGNVIGVDFRFPWNRDP